MNYLIYKIINKVNNKFYIGYHQTEKMNDGYMGSGTIIQRAIKKYGVENFDKYILYNFDNQSSMVKKELEIVNKDFIQRKDTYNVIVGGGFNTSGFITVRNKNNVVMFVSVKDKRYLSGELVHITKGTTTVKDINNKIYQVSINDPKYLSGELVGQNKNTIVVRDKSNNCYRVEKNDPRYLSKELISVKKNLVTVKDKNNNYYCVLKDDKRLKTGELVGTFLGKHHTEETKQLLREKGKENQSGQRNSQFGTCCIYNIELKQNKRIKREELDKYLEERWLKGSRVEFYKKTKD